MENNFLTIGIPIRNEEKNLESFIKSLSTAINILCHTLPKLKIEVLFCINNTTDNSKDIVRKIAFENISNVSLIESEPGKMNAITKIAHTRLFKDSMNCFIDADIILEKNCLLNLVQDLLDHKNIFLVYSSVHPNQNERQGFMQKIQKTHYNLREHINARKYFHGRAYIIRSSEILERNLRLSNKHPNWGLIKGPYVDDIYLSRVIFHEYGPKSIREVTRAKVFFFPPKNIKDFYLGQRRLLLEIERLNLLYPEHVYIQKKYFKKKINWSYFLYAKLSDFFKYLPYFFIEEGTRLLIRFEILLISIGIIKIKSIWNPLKTTKYGKY
ncbi:MAG: glycosyltransferase family 2 protein [Patescibacteria group bacterium]